MAHIFKHSTDGQKGILVFTHKEWGYFCANKLLRRLKREKKLPQLFSEELRQPFRKAFNDLKKKYYIGVHFGAYYPHLFESKIVDFVLSGESNLPNLSPNLVRIPFNSRDFTPALFKVDSDVPKVWDVMTVAQNVKVKNFPLLFSSIKSALEINPEATFLLIVPSQSGVLFGVEKKLAQMYYKIFTREEQEKITFFYLHPDLEWGLHQKQLAYFYNCSKIFTLFSKQEGESRVVSEALCCGLPVVVYKKILGGAADLLNDNNSVLFDSFNNAHLAWGEALDKFPEGIDETTALVTREDYNLNRIQECFAQLYSSDNSLYDMKLDNTDQLYRRLPAHFYDVPWKVSKSAPTADILSNKQFDLFIEQL